MLIQPSRRSHLTSPRTAPRKSPLYLAHRDIEIANSPHTRPSRRSGRCDTGEFTRSSFPDTSHPGHGTRDSTVLSPIFLCVFSCFRTSHTFEAFRMFQRVSALCGHLSLSCNRAFYIDGDNDEDGDEDDGVDEDIKLPNTDDDVD